jgi:hypothetical protein
MSYLGNSPFSPGTITRNTVIATAAQAVFTVPGGYAVSLLQVHMNGILLRPVDYTAIDGSTITLAVAANANDEVEFMAFTPQTYNGAGSITRVLVTATASQSVFTGLTYPVNMIDVYLNGSRLAPSDFVATDGTTVTLASGVVSGTEVLFHIYSAMSLASAVPAAGGSMSGNLNVPSLNAGYIGGNRNRIINGDMKIDQRNAGASFTPTDATYGIDRWKTRLSLASKFSLQRLSATPPPGFTHYLRATSLSAYSITSSDYFLIVQPIEGYNISDLAFGSSSANVVILSFRVRSSLTGSFGGAIRNSAANRSYPFQYSIPVANTWTIISIPISGDITGTWATDNTSGLEVFFALGCGSTFSGPASTWAAANYTSASGAVSLVGTNAATLDITGAQLELGTIATPFEKRIYSVELEMCQRYYEPVWPLMGVAGSTTALVMNINFSVVKRAQATPSMIGGSNLSFTMGTATANTTGGITGYTNYMTASGGEMVVPTFSGLSAGSCYINNSGGSGTALAFDAEI